ncbi:UPF0193 protein EVG1 isoform 6-T6 [Spinachia spinachia]
MCVRVYTFWPGRLHFKFSLLNRSNDAAIKTHPPPAKKDQRKFQDLPCKPQRRSAEACRLGNSYVREKYHPGPTRDLEKEKTRLQNILATGKEEPTPSCYKNVPACPNPEVAEQKDRYQEVLDEIEERRQFLADMSSLGEEKQYVNIINTEISQRIRELRVLDKNRSAKNSPITSEQKEDGGKDGV